MTIESNDSDNSVDGLNKLQNEQPPNATREKVNEYV